MIYITDYNNNKIWEDHEVYGNELVGYYQRVHYNELDRYAPFYGSLILAIFSVLIAIIIYEVSRSIWSYFNKQDKNWPPKI